MSDLQRQFLRMLAKALTSEDPLINVNRLEEKAAKLVFCAEFDVRANADETLARISNNLAAIDRIVKTLRENSRLAPVFSQRISTGQLFNIFSQSRNNERATLLSAGQTVKQFCEHSKNVWNAFWKYTVDQMEQKRLRPCLITELAPEMVDIMANNLAPSAVAALAQTCRFFNTECILKLRPRFRFRHITGQMPHLPGHIILNKRVHIYVDLGVKRKRAVPLTADPSVSDGLSMSNDHISQMLPSDAVPDARTTLESLQANFEDVFGPPMPRDANFVFELLEIDNFMSRNDISVTLVNAATLKPVEARNKTGEGRAISNHGLLYRRSAPTGCESMRRPFQARLKILELSSNHSNAKFRLRANVVGYKDQERKVIYAYSEPFHVISKAKVVKSKRAS